MNVFLLNEYGLDADSDKISTEGYNEMKRLDSLHEPWKIVIDIDRPRFFDDLSSYIHRGSYNFLDSVEVTDEVAEKFHLRSENGCLINSNNDRLMFVPESKITSIPVSVKSLSGCLNDMAYKSLVAQNFREYLENPDNRAYFEWLLSLAPDFITGDMINGCCFNFTYDDTVIPDYEREMPLSYKMCNMTLRQMMSVRSHFRYLLGKKSHTSCRVTLSDEIKTRHYDGFSIEEIGNVFSGLKLEGNLREKRNLNPEIFAPFDEDVLGEYIAETDEIILYPNAMIKTGKHGDDLTDLLISVLAHEIFHHLHFEDIYSAGTLTKSTRQNMTCFDGEYEYAVSVITESLASAFQYVYTYEILHNISLADGLLDSWKRHSILIYPYSGAETVLSGCRSLAGDISQNRTDNEYMIHRFVWGLRNAAGRDHGARDNLTDAEDSVRDSICEREILGNFMDYYYSSLNDPSNTGGKLIIDNLLG